MRGLASILATFLVTGSAMAAGTGAATQTEATLSEDSGRDNPLVERERHVVLMPVAGVWNHPFEGAGVTAKVSPVFGLDVKIEPLRWLNVRASVLQGKQLLETAPDRLAKGFDVYQPTLSVTRLQLRVEPTLELAPGFSGYIGVGAGWGRVVAPEATATPRLHSYRRASVYLAYEAALGFCYELMKDRIVIDLSAAGALLADQSGSLFDTVQAFSDEGHRTYLSGLPHFSANYRSMLGLGVIL